MNYQKKTKLELIKRIKKLEGETDDNISFIESNNTVKSNSYQLLQLKKLIQIGSWDWNLKTNKI